MIQEFKEFLTKTNALALAIGVIIGAAAGKLVSKLVEDIMMPIISLIMPKGEWQSAAFELGRTTNAKGEIVINAIKYGDFLGAVIDFVVIAFVVFMVTKALIKPAPAVPALTCAACKTDNAVDATRCKACTSELIPA